MNWLQRNNINYHQYGCNKLHRSEFKHILTIQNHKFNPVLNTSQMNNLLYLFDNKNAQYIEKQQLQYFKSGGNNNNN